MIDETNKDWEGIEKHKTPIKRTPNTKESIRKKRTRKRIMPEHENTNDTILKLKEELLDLRSDIKLYKDEDLVEEYIYKRERQKTHNRAVGYQKRKLKTLIRKEKSKKIKSSYEQDLLSLQTNDQKTLAKYGLKPALPLSMFDDDIDRLKGNDMTMIIDDSMGLSPNKTYKIKLSELLKKYNPTLFILEKMKKRAEKMLKFSQGYYDRGEIEPNRKSIITEGELEGLRKLHDAILYNIEKAKGNNPEPLQFESSGLLTFIIVHNNIRIN